MLSPSIHARRRHALQSMVDGPILLFGNGTRARNLPMNQVRFRQDSSFLYLTGCDLPDAAAWIDGDRCTLFVPAPADDDALWHGHVDTLDAMATRYGVASVRDSSELERVVAGRDAHTLAVADTAVNARIEALTGQPHHFGENHGSDALVDALIALRRTKTPEELEQMRVAARRSAEAHHLVMRLTRPGVSEASLAAVFEAYLASRGCALGYETILTQHGEILHNHDHSGVLEAGRLLLLDGGGELPSGYGADITRTWPVSGTFSPRQRAAYEAVRAAQEAAFGLCRAGIRYRDVHDAASRVLAQFLLDEGVLHDISVDSAVERGAHALFFPHGVGHHLGLDVHDLEAFGDRSSYAPGAARPEPFGTCYLRLDLPLEPGWVVTVEPGFYAVPAILDDPVLRERFADVVNDNAARSWLGIGGIRIEDDVVITEAEPEILTLHVPSAPDAVEALVGAGASIDELLA